MKMRMYRTVRGIWGFGLSRSPGGWYREVKGWHLQTGHWHLQIGPWVITTEPEEETGTKSNG